MTNSWWEIKIICDPILEESIFWRLDKFGCSGTATEFKPHKKSCLISAYLPKVNAEFLDIAALTLWLKQDAMIMDTTPPVTRWQLIDEENWHQNWKDQWQPLDVGSNLLIYPAWLEYPTETTRTLLRLDPGVAFGTGTHPTTQLCLESLEMRLLYPVEGQEHPVIADIGCGSGILGIAAALMGAAKVYGVDTDPLAMKAAKENRDLNSLDQNDFLIKQGSVETLIDMGIGPCDGIVCNILAEIIIEIIPKLDSLIKPTTWAVFSGILLDQAKSIAETLEQNGWLVATLWKRGEWCCFNARRDPEFEKS
jgi:ribosomal protein L11 methyltransferase